MNITKEEILSVVKDKGPIIPLDIKRALNKGDSMIIGAMLSQLINSGEVKITNVKLGSSPFYYVKEQLEKLEELSEYLNEKDKRAYNLLREEKVLRDNKLEPIERVSLRNIPDFSKKLVVSISGEKEIFWKYYLLSDNQGVEVIKQKIIPQKQIAKKQEEKKEPQKPVQKEPAVETKKEVKEQQKTLEDDNDRSEFENMLRTYFDAQGIIVVKKEVVRKNSEYDFNIRLRTALGDAEFYCKARNKKKVPDGDIADAYLQGLIKRSPTVFITNGEVAKKSKDKLKTHYKGLIIKEIK
ncbi:MAG: hypothetical protein ACMXX9_00575 [Candidatus Woesearchaeota archaeon]